MTIEHICSVCLIPGHGCIECGDIVLLNKLKEYYNDTINIPCTFESKVTENKCKSNTHNINNHICIFCNKYSTHHMLNCPELGIKISDDIITIPQKLQEIKLKIGTYTSINYMYNIFWLLRCNNKNIMEYLFVNSNNMSPNDNNSDFPRYKAFTYNYEYVKFN
jgi:hypothetical protein